MNDYLVFRLYGMLSSWGEIAVGESRHSATHPSKSAVLGMVAAALGIDRDEEEFHHTLNKAYGFGVKVISPGHVLKDYHTTQVPPERKNTFYHTRRDELKAEKLGTILSSREYRCDALYIVALWPRISQVPYSLVMIKEALMNPKYCLYLGRKSCPPSLPLSPAVVREKTLKEALDKDVFHPMDEYDPGKGVRMTSYHWEDTESPGMKSIQKTVRHDDVLSRKRWQFGTRRENVFFEQEGR